MRSKGNYDNMVSLIFFSKLHLTVFGDKLGILQLI